MDRDEIYSSVIFACGNLQVIRDIVYSWLWVSKVNQAKPACIHPAHSHHLPHTVNLLNYG